MQDDNRGCGCGCEELEKLKYVVHIESDDTYIVYEKPNLNS